MSAHAKIGPSSLSRVIRCPGSVRKTEGLPRRSSKAAAEGTVLHEIAELCLLYGLEPHDFFGQRICADGFEFEIGLGDGQVDPTVMQAGLDWLREQPGDLYIEQRVSLDRWMPGQFGTLDVGIIDWESRTATVFDWKFGSGVRVDPVENEQLMAYAAGFVEANWPFSLQGDPKAIRIIIEQPRCVGGASFADAWVTTWADLQNFGEVMRETYAAASEPDAPLIPGRKQCMFCDAKNREPADGSLGGCPAYDKFMVDMLGAEFDDLDEQIATDAPPKLSENLTGQRRAHIVKHADLIRSWLAKLHEDSLNAALAGAPDPGMKVVIGQKGNRRWTDPEAVEALLVSSLHDDAFIYKLKSPAQAETALKPKRGKPGDPETWDALGKLITQDDGKPVLVDAGDARPAITPLVDLLDDLD